MSSFIPIQLWQIPPTTITQSVSLPPLIQNLEQQLSQIAQQHKKVVLANSLAVEDMVLTHAIAQLQLPVEIIVLDTGKLHAEALSYLDIVKKHYDRLTFTVYRPLPQSLQDFEVTHEFLDIYQSLSVRKACCFARKIEPLQRALAHKTAWITGQRREQSPTRQQLPQREWDTAHNLEKFNPLADWTHEQVWAYIHAHSIPIHPLYHHGMPSIGCEPCTKPIRQGEDLRAGRWWWESQDSKECGLHANPTSSLS